MDGIKDVIMNFGEKKFFVELNNGFFFYKGIICFLFIFYLIIDEV